MKFRGDRADNCMPVVYRDMPCGTRWNGVVGTGRGNTERAGTRRPSRVGEAGE